MLGGGENGVQLNILSPQGKDLLNYVFGMRYGYFTGATAKDRAYVLVQSFCANETQLIAMDVPGLQEPYAPYV